VDHAVPAPPGVDRVHGAQHASADDDDLPLLSAHGGTGYAPCGELV
jgi:hypothetical protein